MEITSSDMSIEPRQYAKMFWRRKGVILLSVLTVFCSALVALSFMQDEYEATVRLVFEEPKTPLPEVTPQSPSGSREDARLNAFAARIRSGPFLARVVERLPMMTSAPNIRAAAEEINRKNPQLSVDQIAVRLAVERIQSRLRFGSRGSGIYEVVVAHSDPVTAVDLAQYIGDDYMVEFKQLAIAHYQQTLTWLHQEIRLREERVREAEENLKEYGGSQIKEAMSRGAVGAENLRTAESMLRRVRQAVEVAEDRERKQAAELARAGTKKASDASLSETDFSQSAEPLKECLIGKVDDRLAVVLPADEFPWPPPEYNALRQKLGTRLSDEVRSNRPQAKETTVDATVAYLLSRIDAHTQSEVARDLEKRIEDYKQHAQSQTAQDLELLKLNQDLEDKRAELNLFRDNETRNKNLQEIHSASLGQQVGILDPPQLPLSPSRPNRVKILLGALLLGTMFGFGLAFLSEIMDPTVRTLADIQRVAPEPVLCTTPLLSKLQPRVLGIRRFWLPAAVSAVVLVTAAFFVARLMVQEEPIPGALPVGAASESQTGG